MTNAIRAHVHDLLARRDLWDLFPVGIALWDGDGRLLHANPVLLRWAGHPLENLRGRPYSELCAFLNLGLPAWEALPRGQASTPHLARLDTPEGPGRFVESHLFLCLDAAGAWTGVFQIVLDRTDRRAAERAAHLAVTGELAAAVAHDLKNHLAAAMGYLDLLDPFVEGRGRPLVQSLRRNLVAIRDHAQRLLASGERLAGGAGTADLGQVLVAALATVMPQASARRVYLDVSLPERELAVAGHPRRLEQAFINLLLNAIEASPGGGRVSVTTESGPRGVEVAVADQGPGMTAETLRRVGEPFFSTKPDGSGLGVFLVREILADYGGWLTYRSRPGEGTEARVRLVRVHEAEGVRVRPGAASR